MRGLESQVEYIKAEAVVKRLEKRVKGGVATERERERYRNGIDHILIYLWTEEGRRQSEDIRRKRGQKASAVPARPLLVRDDTRPGPGAASPVVGEEGLLRRQMQLMQARRAGRAPGQE